MTKYKRYDIIKTVKGGKQVARPKKFSYKLQVGLTPELKEFLEKESEKEACDMNVIIRRALMEYMEKRNESNKK